MRAGALALQPCMRRAIVLVLSQGLVGFECTGVNYKPLGVPSRRED